METTTIIGICFVIFWVIVIGVVIIKRLLEKKTLTEGKITEKYVFSETETPESEKKEKDKEEPQEKRFAEIKERTTLILDEDDEDDEDDEKNDEKNISHWLLPEQNIESNSTTESMDGLFIINILPKIIPVAIILFVGYRVLSTVIEALNSTQQMETIATNISNTNATAISLTSSGPLGAITGMVLVGVIVMVVFIIINMLTETTL